MVIDIVAIILFAIVFALLIAFMYFRETELQKKFKIYEEIIEDLTNKVHLIEKNRKTELSLKSLEFKDEIRKIEKNLNNRVDDLGDPILKIIKAIKNVETVVDKTRDDVNKRIGEIENRTKNILALSKTNSSFDFEKILELHKKGFSYEEIAKNQRVPQGEIEFILKMGNQNAN